MYLSTVYVTAIINVKNTKGAHFFLTKGAIPSNQAFAINFSINKIWHDLIFLNVLHYSHKYRMVTSSRQSGHDSFDIGLQHRHCAYNVEFRSHFDAGVVSSNEHFW